MITGDQRLHLRKVTFSSQKASALSTVKVTIPAETNLVLMKEELKFLSNLWIDP